MAKLSKRQRAIHAQAEQLLSQDRLSNDDVEFVLTHWHEGATSMNGEAGAFFTPLDLAFDFALDCFGQMPGGDYSHLRVIDLCAGIGCLSYALTQRFPGIKIVAVEANSTYVEVGRKVLPNVEWHCMSVTDLDAIKALGNFDLAISNPPFGAVRTMRDSEGLSYTGAHAEYKVMEIAAMVADSSVFIVPNSSSPFRYSGVSQYQEQEPNKLKAFLKQVPLELSIGLGVNTTAYTAFKDAKVTVEFVTVDNSVYRERQVTALQEASTEDQMDLFGAIAA